MDVREVVVIGGGISGCAAAYELARGGARVTLVERGGLAAMASGWTLAGVRQSGRHPAELPLARAAVRRWERLREELDADVEYRQDGNLRLARTPEEVPVIAGIVEQQRALGLDLRFLPDNAAVRAVAPALSESVLAASFCPTDGHANPHLAVRAFARAAERAGAVIRTETAVTAIEAAGGRVRGVRTTGGALAADAVAVAAGVYTDRLLRPLGLDLPITIAHTAVVQTVPLLPLIAPVLGVANGDIAGRQEVGGRLRFTGRAESWPWPEPRVDPAALQPPARTLAAIIERAATILPALGTAGVERVWGGLLDLTPDGLPVIERVPAVAGLVVAAGFSGHGFCLGPATGQIIAELVAGGATSFPIAPFRLGRLAADRQVAAPQLHG